MYVKKIVAAVDGVQITYTHSTEAGARETKFKAWRTPHPDFGNAGRQVVKHAAAQLGAGAWLDEKENCRLKEVHVDTTIAVDKGEARIFLDAATVVLERNFAKVEKPAIIKTPKMLSVADAESVAMKMSDDLAAAIVTFVHEAKEMMNGKSAQEDMFKKPDSNNNDSSDALPASGRDDEHYEAARILAAAVAKSKGKKIQVADIQRVYDIGYARAYQIHTALKEDGFFEVKEDEKA